MDSTHPDILEHVHLLNGDIRDKAIVERAMQDIDIVIHAAAALPLYKNKDITTTDVEGTANVLEAAYEHDVERMIHISSTAVYGVPDHHPVLEEDKLDGVGTYGKAKIKAEEICVKYRKKGMCIPILRPKSFIGPERLGVFALLYDWAKDGKNFPIIGNGCNKYQLLDVEDLCEAIYLVATQQKDKVNDTFNVGAKEFGTIREDFQAVLDYAGFGKNVKTFPAGPVIYILRILEFLRLSPLYGWIYETISKDSMVSIEKAQKVLSFTPRYSNKDALLRNFNWYLGNLSRFGDKSGVSHTVPWKQGILRLAKMFF